MAKQMPTVTLFDNFYGAYTYEDYVDYCTNNEIEPMEDGSQDYYDFISDMESRDYEDLLLNLKYSEEAQVPVAITGTLGLWNGDHDIIPVRCENIAAAIKKCLGHCDYFKIEQKKGEIHVTAAHHDGTNTFVIHKLSPRGLAWDGGELKEYRLCKWHGYLF